MEIKKRPLIKYKNRSKDGRYSVELFFMFIDTLKSFPLTFYCFYSVMHHFHFFRFIILYPGSAGGHVESLRDNENKRYFSFVVWPTHNGS